MKRFLFFILLVGVTFQSCKKPIEEVIPRSRISTEGVTNRDGSSEITKHEGGIILGAKIPNPLSVENMKTAWNNLYDEKITLLLPTHKYVRFLPTRKEFKLLQKMDNLILFDYPLDREITKEGLSYHDPNIPKNNVTWQYAFVDINFSSPIENYEVLSELVAPEYNSQWVKEAYRIKDLAYGGTPFGELDATAPNITVTTAGQVIHPPGGLSCSYPCVKAWKNGKEYCDCDVTPTGDDPVSACGCDPSGNEHVPTGSVQVWDTQHNGGQWEGVEGVKIYTWRQVPWGHLWGKSTYTDINGCWKVNRQYKHKSLWTGKYVPITLGLRLKFKNDKIVFRGMATQTDFVGFAEAVKDVMSRTAIDLRDFCIKYGPATPMEAEGEARKRYYAATAMNAFFEYNRYAIQDGILPLDGMDILLHPFDLGGASTPMLDHLNNVDVVSHVIEAQGVHPFLSAILGPASVAVMGPFVWPVLVFEPDITYPYRNNDNNSDQIKETFYHEFAHASHFFLQLPEYWLDNIRYVVENESDSNNPPYGTFTTPESGRTAVIEMWGMHYGMTLADRQYGIEHSEGDASDPDDMTRERYNFQLERFVPNGTGMPGGFPADSWIPYGAFHDCSDNNALNPANVSEPISVTDGVLGFPHAAFFASLTAAENVPTVRDRLTTVLPTGQTTTTVNALFSSYGY